MDIAQWITLGVALIGVTGSLIVAVLQLKRDGKTIDKINTTTSDTLPKVCNIEKHAEKSKELLAEYVKPELAVLKGNLQDTGAQIAFIAKEVEHQQRMKKELSEGAIGRDRVLTEMETVFDENARLNIQHQTDVKRIRELESYSADLLLQNKKLRADLKMERSRNAQQNEPDSSYDEPEWE